MKLIRNVVACALLAGGAVVTATAGLSIASAADEGYGGGWHGHGHHGGGGWMFHKLNLTDEQKTSIKTIFTNARPQMKTLHEQMQANHLKLEQTKPDDPNYGTVVAQVAQSNATLASQRTTQGAQLMAQMYAVLTPAQKTQLATLKAQAVQHAQERAQERAQEGTSGN